MTSTEYDRLCSATRRMTVEMTHTSDGEWLCEIHTSYFPAEGEPKSVRCDAYASTPEAAFRKAMKQLRWELRDAPALASAASLPSGGAR